MKLSKLDNLISLSPLLLAALIPIGRYLFGKSLKKKEKSNI